MHSHEIASCFNNSLNCEIILKFFYALIDTKFEELQVEYSKEVEERKRLEAELKNMKSQVIFKKPCTNI